MLSSLPSQLHSLYSLTACCLPSFLSLSPSTLIPFSKHTLYRSSPLSLLLYSCPPPLAGDLLLYVRPFIVCQITFLSLFASFIAPSFLLLPHLCPSSNHSPPFNQKQFKIFKMFPYYTKRRHSNEIAPFLGATALPNAKCNSPDGASTHHCPPHEDANLMQIGTNAKQDGGASAPACMRCALTSLVGP